jgi:hypothetical protein
MTSAAGAGALRASHCSSSPTAAMVGQLRRAGQVPPYIYWPGCWCAWATTWSGTSCRATPSSAESVATLRPSGTQQRAVTSCQHARLAREKERSVATMPSGAGARQASLGVALVTALAAWWCAGDGPRRSRPSPRAGRPVWAHGDAPDLVHDRFPHRVVHGSRDHCSALRPARSSWTRQCRSTSCDRLACASWHAPVVHREQAQGLAGGHATGSACPSRPTCRTRAARCRRVPDH